MKKVKDIAKGLAIDMDNRGLKNHTLVESIANHYFRYVMKSMGDMKNQEVELVGLGVFRMMKNTLQVLKEDREYKISNVDAVLHKSKDTTKQRSLETWQKMVNLCSTYIDRLSVLGIKGVHKIHIAKRVKDGESLDDIIREYKEKHGIHFKPTREYRDNKKYTGVFESTV